MPACTTAEQPGLTSRALTWNGHGWGALVADNGTVFLREFTVDGAPSGDRVALVDAPAAPARLSLAWSNDGYVAAVAPHHGDAPTQLFAVRNGRTDGEAYALDDRYVGDPRLVARDDGSTPAAMLTEDDRGVTSLRLVARDGAPGEAHRCPPGVTPRAVVAWGEGFRALRVGADPSTGEARGVDLVSLDARCAVQWQTRLYDGVLVGAVHALAVDARGAVAAFEARDDGTWIAGVDHGGAVRIRPRRMERQAHDPEVFAQSDGSGRRHGIVVVAVRTIETGDRLEAWRLDAEGLLRDTHTVATSNDVQVRAAVGDPWGGGLVAFTRAESARAEVLAGFFARVCP